MVRGNSLVEDLGFLIGNSRYSDLVIRCKNDVVLYGNRAILAARSEVLNRMLFTEMTEIPCNQISFPDVEILPMKVILKYLYTEKISESDVTTENAFGILHAANFFQLENLQDDILGIYKRLCKKKGNEKKLPELLSRATYIVSSLADNSIIHYLVNSVARIPLDTMEFNRLSFQGLQCLLLMRDRTQIFSSSEYSVFRFVILTAATRISGEAFCVLEKKLPPWNEIEELLNAVKNSSIGEEIGTSVADIISPVVDYIEFRRIDAKVIAKIIEPLNIVPINNILDSYRFQACVKTQLPPFYGDSTIKWDRVCCGPDLKISEDGETVSASPNTNGHQSVRTNKLMRSGTHEFHVQIESACQSCYFGVCGEDLDFSDAAGSQPYGWVLGSSGLYYNDYPYPLPDTRYFGNDNDKIIIYLDMDKKKISFSINNVEHEPPDARWKNLTSNLYFVVSFCYPGKFKILLPDHWIKVKFLPGIFDLI
ncbi:2194_t:CDS:1 [Acaulospora morrowiae]|uniref:2194_t:CDS:1 n=1 Tax=Acaulospora morrowiae TaxID=94023 RepID=A0A9N9BZ21_9GLOM|nr:2194_t:CDS:1 [Acaulospora morrowiae]